MQTELKAYWHNYGLTSYDDGLDLQQSFVLKCLNDQIAAMVIFLEHSPTFTLGKRGKDEHILVTQKELDKSKIKVYRTERGGDVTFHGPGQLVCYPILNLKNFNMDLTLYARNLEEVIIRLLVGYGITAGRLAGYPGVWFQGEKIAALGVHVKQGVTSHGFALNVYTDLAYFKMILPCGITDKDVTSMAKILGYPPKIEEVHSQCVNIFQDVFNLELQRINVESL